MPLRRGRFGGSGAGHSGDMTDAHDHETSTTAERPRGDDRVVVTERAVPQSAPQPVHVTERKLSVRSFVAGFLTAALAAAIAAAVFLAVSDSDDDGEIEVDVPAVDVDVDG